MAVNYTKPGGDEFGAHFGLTYQRDNAKPLDSSLYFNTFEEAKRYAADGATAYVGAIVTVKSGGIYVIRPNGTLQPIVISEILENKLTELDNKLSANIGDAGYQGTVADIPASFKRGMVFSSNADSIDAFNAAHTSEGIIKLTDTNLEAGDWLIAKKDGSLSDVTDATKFLEYFGVWEKNLTGAATKVNNGASEAGKYVSSITKDANGDTINVTKTDLPVKQVVVNGSGNVITGATFNTSGNANTLTLTKGTISTKNKFIKRYCTGTEGDGYYAFTKIDDLGKAHISQNVFGFNLYTEDLVIQGSNFTDSDLLVYLNGVLVPFTLDETNIIVGDESIRVEEDDVITLVGIIG